MQTRILSAVLMAFSTTAFAEGAFTLQFDNPSKEGGFTQNQLLSAPYGFGCSGGQCFARAVVEKSARRDKKFRPDRLR